MSQLCISRMFIISVKARYGGCVATSYSQALSCKKLFGGDSDLDPAVLFNMLPGMDSIIESMEKEFQHNITEAFRTLFSNGSGTESFINGCFKLMNNLGINIKKAIPLTPYLEDLVNVTLPRPTYWTNQVTLSSGISQTVIDEAFNRFMTKLRQVIDSYESDYPESELPELVWKIAQYFNASYNLPSTTKCYYGHHALNFDMGEIKECLKSRQEAASKLNNLAIDIMVDVQFYVLNEFDFLLDLNLFEVRCSRTADGWL